MVLNIKHSFLEVHEAQRIHTYKDFQLKIKLLVLNAQITWHRQRKTMCKKTNKERAVSVT